MPSAMLKADIYGLSMAFNFAFFDIFAVSAAHAEAVWQCIPGTNVAPHWRTVAGFIQDGTPPVHVTSDCLSFDGVRISAIV